MKIGIFGGTFDPPHMGHFILASEGYAQLGLDCVFWVLTPTPPHKPDRNITAHELREKMLELVLERDPNFILSRVDIKRSPPHYAVDTLEIFEENHPDDELFYLIGGDSLRDLHLWARPQQLIDRVDGLAVYSRSQANLASNQYDPELKGLDKKLIQIEGPLIEISSSDIRLRIREGRPYRYFLPTYIHSFIEKHHLYS